VIKMSVTRKNYDHFQAYYRKDSGHAEMPIFHKHHSYEVCYVFSGLRQFIVGKRIITIKTGDLIIINRDTLHRASKPEIIEDYERLILYFDDVFVSNLNNFFMAIKSKFALSFHEDYIILHLSPEQRNQVRQLSDSLFCPASTHQKPGKDWQSAYDSIIFSKLLLTIQSFYNANKKENPVEVVLKKEEKYAKIFEIIDFLTHNYTENISLESVADQFYISISTIVKYFKLITGISFNQYLVHLRIQKAMHLLHTTNKSIVEISELVGFKTLSNFNKAFKQIVGSTPKQYKKLTDSLEIEEPYI